MRADKIDNSIKLFRKTVTVVLVKILMTKKKVNPELSAKRALAQAASAAARRECNILRTDVQPAGLSLSTTTPTGCLAQDKGSNNSTQSQAAGPTAPTQTDQHPLGLPVATSSASQPSIADTAMAALA